MSSLSSDLNYGIDLDPKTSEALARFAHRRRGLLLVRAVAAGIVTLVATMLLVAVCDYLWLLSDSARWVFSLTGYVLTIAAVWWFGIRHYKECSPQELARHMESAEPQLREDLLSAVELADPASANGSAGFRESLQRRVAHQVVSLDIGRLLPISLIRRWLSTGAVVAIVSLVLLFVPQLQFGRRIARAMLPGLAIERASLTEVTIIEPSPPSGFVAEGDAVAIVAQIGGEPTDDVMLFWRTAEGVEGETAMTPRVNPQAAQKNGTLQHQPLFAANLSVGSIPVEYRIVAGDAITLWHKLTPLPRPRVESFQKRYRFPDYAKLEDRVEDDDHGDLKAIVGTMAEVMVRFDEPVQNAALRYGMRGVEVPLRAVDDGGQSFVVSIPIKTPGQYQIDAASVRSGLNNPFSPQYTITPVIDSPPVVRWGPSIAQSALVSPLDVVSLSAIVRDDLPVDTVFQEFRVNGGQIMRRDIAIAQPDREMDPSWQWDLMRLDGDDATPKKLSGGDIVETRIVAVDRRASRGEARFVEFLVTDEGFNVDRHARLEQQSALVSEVIEWAKQLGKFAELTKEISQQGDSARLDAARELADPIHEQTAEIMSRLEKYLESSATVHEAGLTELAGRAMLDVDRQVVATIENLSDVVAEQLADWQTSRERALRELAGEGRAIEQNSARIQQLLTSAFGQELTVGVVSDLISMQRSLRPLLDRESKMPLERFPRYLTVTIGRVDAVGKLIEAHEASLPDSTRRHLENAWTRWAEDWTGRLNYSIKDPPGEDNYRALIEQFSRELLQRIDYQMIDGRLAATMNDMVRDVHVQIGSASEKLRQVTTFGEAGIAARVKAENEKDSKLAAAANRDVKFVEANFARALEGLLQRLESEETLHRRRPTVDLLFAADLGLMRRAVENVTQDGYLPYRDEPAAQVHQKLANEFQIISAAHDLGLLNAELAALLEAERRLETGAISKIQHPAWVERLSVGMEWPIRILENYGFQRDQIEPFVLVRNSPAYIQARERITKRRWDAEDPISADSQLESVHLQLATALAAIAPRVDQAREVIKQYVLTLAEQAREAAEKAKQAKQRIEERPDASQQTAAQLDEQQQDAEQAAQETVASLVDIANTASILDKEERELARDADAAAANIQDASERAEQEMERATKAENQPQRESALERTADALQELADALEKTAEHFERAENGEDITASREQLRAAEAELNIDDSLQDRYDQAEATARAAQTSPEEMLRQLERELARNEPMQQELSEIAQRAIEDAQRTLDQAAEDEKSLNQSLERSDEAFQEQKRRTAKQIEDLARRTKMVDERLLSATETAIGWANDPESRPRLSEARENLREAAEKANQLGGENALLSEMQQALSEMTAATQEAREAVSEVQQRAEKSAAEDIHQDDSKRQNSKRAVERTQRDTRDQQVRDAREEEANWNREEREAGQRIQRADQNERRAEIDTRRMQDLLKKDPDNESLKQQLAQTQQRQQDAAATEEAATQTRELAKQMKEQAVARKQKLEQRKLQPLDKPNPAAELASQMSQEAVDNLEQISNELQKLSDQAAFEQELRSPESQAKSQATRQEQITAEVSDAVEQLERAARHEQRLGHQETAQQLSETAESVAQNAENAARQAGESLGNATEDAAQSPQASQDVAKAAEQIGHEAERLAEILANAQQQQQQADDAAQAAQTGEPESRAQQLAQTLDELDRSLAQASQSPSEQGQPGQEQGQPGQEQGQPGQEQGQQPGQPSSPQTAAEASQTIASAVNAQSQAAARQRQQQMQPGSQGQPQPGKSSDQPPSVAGTESGSGEMPSGGSVDVSDIDRLGDQWGQLRERRTDDAMESRKAAAAQQYRREIEAYFRVIAQRAAERAE